MQSRPMAVAVTNRDIYVFAREIDVMQRARNAEVDFGMYFCKAAEPMDEPLGSKIRRCAHGQHARTLPLYQALGSHGDTVKRLAHNRQIIAPGIGDDQPLSLAIEELDAKLRLQRLHLMAHGALRDAQLLGWATVFRPRLRALWAPETAIAPTYWCFTRSYWHWRLVRAS